MKPTFPRALRGSLGTGLIAAVLCLTAHLAQAETPVIHVYSVFCNAYPGDAGAINDSVSADQFLISTLFTEHIPERGWGVRVRRVEVSKDQATREQIQKGFREFVRDVHARDTVFVYFSGHGVILEEATGVQFLQTCDLELINRKEWAEAIDDLPARLKIFITDCCSSYPPSRELAEGSDDVVPWETLYFLFLREEGFVNITAASPGQFAYGTERGGYLTVNLQSDMQRYRTWREVFKASQDRVFVESEAEARLSGDPNRTPQRPFAYSLGRPRAGSDAPLPESVAYVIPDSRDRRLSRGELDRMGLQHLYLARNEIFARHGFDFQTPLLQRYFASRPWYRRRPGFKDPALTAIEKANAEAILAAEKAQGGPFVTHTTALPGNPGATAPPDIFPYSSARPLPRSVVQSLSLPELNLARNEIYARHGYPFQSRALRDYFARKPWYRRDPGATNPRLSQLEEQNVWLIKKIERLKGGPHQW